jgi:site-specific DNA-cytosine methylase
MKVLIACEFSGVVRDAFTALGHDAISCDLLPTESPGYHWQGDIFECLKFHHYGFDLMIAHPPCTYLTVTANKWMKPEWEWKFPTRKQDRIDAINFFMELVNVPIEKIAIENPVGIMSTKYRKPDQIIQPYQFGHTESKKTCLWLKNLPKLVPTDIVDPVYLVSKGKKYSGAAYYSKRSLCHLDYLPPKEDRWKLRSKTFSGIASAMADQWGK